MSDPNLYQAMLQATSQTLANMAFTEVMEHYDPNCAIPSAEQVWTSLLISAPVEGEVRLAMTTSLLKKLTALIYISAPEQIHQAQMDDSLQELLNTISGTFMRNLLADNQTFQLELPKVGQGPLPEPGANTVAWKLMTVDEEPLQLFVVGAALTTLTQAHD